METINDYYAEEARKEIENRKHKVEMHKKAWEKVERIKKKDGSDFKNLSQNFTKGAIGGNRFTGEPEIRAYITDEKMHSFSDEMSACKTIERHEEEKYREEGRLIERGEFLKPYIVLTPDEIMAMVKERIKYYEKIINEYNDALEKFDEVAGKLIDLRNKAKQIIAEQNDSTCYIFERMFKEERQ